MSDKSTGLAALATLAQYPLKIDAAGDKAANVAMGPWKLYVYCTYGACNANWKKYWWDVNFAASRNYLQRVCDGAEQQAKTFLRSFQPINSWMKTTLPNYSRLVATNTAAIQKTLSAVQGNNPTSEQRQEVSRLLKQLATDLSQSELELKAGVTSMGGFLSQQETWSKWIQDAKTSIVSEGQSVLTRMKDFTAGQPCGQGDANNQRAQFQSNFDSAVQQYESIFSGLRNDSTNANAAVAQLMGVVVNTITLYAALSETINSVQGPVFVQFLEKIKVGAAENQWGTLAEYATQQLQTPALSNILSRAA